MIDIHYIRPAKLEELTGLTAKAMEHFIADGEWAEGCTFARRRMDASSSICAHTTAGSKENMGRNNESGGIAEHRGKIQLTFMFRGRRCRPTLDLAYNERNRRYALRLFDEVKTKIRAGIFNAADYFPDYAALVGPAGHNGGTFGELAQAWLASLGRLASSTQISYERTLDLHWRPHLDDRSIDSIRYSELEALLASLPLVTAKTRNNTLIPLRGVFEFARKDRRISDNPAALLQNAPVQIDPPDPLTLAEMNAILADMATHYAPEVTDYFEAALRLACGPRN